MYRFPSRAIVFALASTITNLYRAPLPERNVALIKHLEMLKGPQRLNPPSRKGAHKYGKKRNMNHVSKRVRRKHRRAA